MRASDGVLRTFRMLERMCTCKFLRRVGVRLISIDNSVTKGGWVLPENEAGTQVSSGFCTIERRFVGNHVGCRFLNVGPSGPPFHPPNQL